MWQCDIFSVRSKPLKRKCGEARASALVHISIAIISLERRIIKTILYDCNCIIIVVCMLVYKMSW